MTQEITKVRKHFYEHPPYDNQWIVDIVANECYRIGYGQPDGTAGQAFGYDSKEEADAAAALYIAKNMAKDLGVETSTRESKALLDCLVCGGNSPKEKTPPDKKQWGHPDFYKLLDQMADLHSRKNHDYAGETDPLKNLRACGRLNLKPFLGVLVRLQDKWSRLEEFVKSGQLMVKNESVIDTLMDNAVYSLLAIILYQEQLKKEENHRAKLVPGGY